MAAPALDKMPTLSALAVKYTDPAGRGHKIITNTGMSSLTLIKTRPLYALAPSTAQQMYIRELEVYQEQESRGFTLQKLVELESFVPLYETHSGVDLKGFG
jgi:hypothetical protein